MTESYIGADSKIEARLLLKSKQILKKAKQFI